MASSRKEEEEEEEVGLVEEDDDFSSLFEGMVLIDPFISSFSSDDVHHVATTSSSAVVATEEKKGIYDDDDEEESEYLVPHLPPLDSQQSEPLDENLFSDLTLSPDAANNLPLPLPLPKTTTTTSFSSSSSTSTTSSSSSSSSRKKRRGGFRIGYARDTPDPPDTKLQRPPPPSDGYVNNDASASASAAIEIYASINSDPQPNMHESPLASPVTRISSEHKSTADEGSSSSSSSKGDTTTSPPKTHMNRADVAATDLVTDDAADKEVHIKLPSQQQQQQQQPQPQIEEEDDDDDQQQQHHLDPCCSNEGEKLNAIRRHITQKLERIREAASSLSTTRKESVRRRRRAAEDFNSASLKYKDLEKELEEACEAEEFERAERVSEELAAAEKDKEAFIQALREAEAECSSVESKMQEVLELQISAEEEGASMLGAFARGAADGADSILRTAEDHSSKGMEEWLSSTETLEITKMELDIESHLINEARSGLRDSIERLIEDDKKEKELLIEKRDALTDELDKLLVLVRLKEAEIDENNYKIEEVEKKIANVMSDFHNAQSSIDMKYDNLQGVFFNIESETEALSLKKKEVDDFVSEMERKRSKLMELATVCANEAKACLELVSLRKCLAASVLKSIQDKASLANTEEKILEDVKRLRQHVSASRASLQELSSTRAKVQQEVASLKQRIGFIDKRGPELEAEKKVAAAARNFKEAGRIAAEAKALGTEMEGLRDKMEKAIVELDNVETEIKDTVNELQESERLISSKEKEAAIAGCERLQLVATAAMSERKAALEMGDLEEADILLAEAEAANFEAMKLQQAFEFEMEEMGKKASNFISMALIANLSRQELAEMAASMLANVV